MELVTTFVEITIDGIGRGMLWALLGAGITLVFGLGEVLNLAQGVFAVIGAAVAFEVVGFGVHVVPAALVGVGALMALSYAIDKVILSSVYRSEGEERVLVAIFVTVGLLLALEGLLFQRFPGNFSLPGGVPSVSAGGVTILGSSIMNIVVGSVVILSLVGFLNYTYMGSAIRTIALDEVGARLVGVNVRLMRTLIFVLSGALAAIAGILYAIGTQISPGGAFQLTTFALLVSIVGGVRDVRGTILAGIGLGVVFSYASYYVGSYVAMIALFGAVIVTLAVRTEEAL